MGEGEGQRGWAERQIYVEKVREKKGKGEREEGERQLCNKPPKRYCVTQ